MKYEFLGEVVDVIQVKNVDFNGYSFDDPPFSEIPEWLIDAEKRGIVEIDKSAEADYAIWKVWTNGAASKAVPGDCLIRFLSGLILVRDAKLFVNVAKKLDQQDGTTDEKRSG